MNKISEIHSIKLAMSYLVIFLRTRLRELYAKFSDKAICRTGEWGFPWCKIQKSIIYLFFWISAGYLQLNMKNVNSNDKSNIRQ